ncbi:Protein kinase domain family protein [Candida albicans]|uniref:Protein kinase domain family protein n=1 Tax=Candida albicans TaxID=5476 RepID=A0A8H6BS93_CANAX|nr:Protein kinase domain family protein [Candida albicans]
MIDIFDMEDEVSTLTSQLHTKIVISPAPSSSTQELNYKLIDAIDEETIANEKEKEEEEDDDYDDEDDDYLPQGYQPQISSRPIKINNNSNRQRRKSSIVSSYEVNITNSYVSSSLIIDRSPGIVSSGGGEGGGGESNNNSKFVSSVISPPRLSDFEPIKVLGKGSYGKVLLVRQVSTGRLFAQKQLKKASLIINQQEQETDDDDEEEEVVVAELVNHPNIVKLFYAFQDNNKLYLILEYLQGGELFHHLAMEKFMSEKDSSYYIAQMLLGIRYLHLKLKVIYRDLKPENCLLNSFGNLVLTDFGLSKIAADNEDGTTKNHSITGTVQYMAPEILQGDPYDFAVDYWSLGCVAFDLLTGSPPFTGTNPKKILEKMKSIKKNLKFPFYLSLDAKDFLRKLLQVNPEKRINLDDEEIFQKFKQHRFFRYIDWNHLENLHHHQEGEEGAEELSFPKATKNGQQQKMYMPPILPVITDPILAENFDSEFTEMDFTPPLPPPPPPPPPPIIISQLQQQTRLSSSGNNTSDILNIQGFSYTNPKFIDYSLHNK